MRYEHTQYARPWLAAAVGSFLLGMIAITVSIGEIVPILIVMAVSLVAGSAVLVASRLTVRVFKDRLTATFGWGWPRKTVRFSGVEDVWVVRNRWWYGFGIRVIPGGTLWNVWGLDAVEFRLSSGRVVRIGTDEPQTLLAAVGKTIEVG